MNRSSAGLCCLLLALLCCAGSASAETPFSLPDEQAMTRLLDGQLELEKNVSTENGALVSVLMWFQAPPERIWQIILSCEQTFVYVKGLQFCEVLERDDKRALTRHVVDRGWASPRFDFTFETLFTPFGHMEFSLIEGNLKVMQGSWDFHQLKDGVLVRHELMLRPSMPVPRWLVRLSMKKYLPEMMQCLRGLAEGSGSAAASADERQQCPGELTQSRGP